MGKSVASHYSCIEKRDLLGDQKSWVHLKLFQNPRPISFEELYYICRWIGECEDAKYPELYHKGAEMVYEFVRDAVIGLISYNELAIRYKLPKAKMQDPKNYQTPFDLSGGK